MLGPKAKQLQQYVDSADEGSLHAAGGQWSKGERLLRDLAKQLAERGQSFGTDERFSGQSADAASKAFQSSAKKMQDRADQMRQGSQAFHDAATGVEGARKVSNQLNAHAGDQPPTKPPDLKDAEAQSHYQTQNKQFWDNYADNETTASHAITALSENHTRQAAVFQSIHGEAPPPAAPGSGGGSNPVSTGTRPPVTHVPNSGPIHHNSDGDVVVGGDDTPGGVDTPSGGGNDGGNGTTTVPAPGPGPGVVQPPVHTGVPAGPGGPVTAPGPITGAPTTAGGGSIGAVGGVGAVAGGALGGAAAAGLAGGLAGGLNGGLNGLVPVSGGRGGLSASGVRGIGSTARGGAGSVLGRSSGTGVGRAGAGGTAGRGSGRSGRSTGRGGAGRGSRGAAGSRGAGAGAGAGTGRSGKDKQRQGEDRDLFDDGADWLDDEDAAPGLLD